MPDKTTDTFRDIAHRFDLKPEHCLMVGNSLKSDIIPAIEAGWQGILIPYKLVWDMDVHEGDFSHERMQTLESICKITSQIA